jgi:L-fuconolactonase
MRDESQAGLGTGRLDAHQHFWRFDAARDTWITDEMAGLRRDFLPAHLEPELRANGIDACIAVQADPSEDETRFLLELAGENPFIAGVVGWVDLCAPDLAERLVRLADEKLCGIRHIAQAEPADFLARSSVVRGIGKLRDFGLTYDILIYPRQLPAALTLLDRLPEQRFVIDHMAKPEIRRGLLEPWASRMRAVAARPNAWCKVSGLVTEADWVRWRPEDILPYLDIVLAAFGPERLMFGSDWPVCLLAAGYRDVLELVEIWASELTAPEREGFFGGNARRFYGLDD